MSAPELLLLRHAKSDWLQDCSDYTRPLNSRGRRDAPRLGHWLKRQQLLPDCVMSSPAQRARQTVEAVCQNAGIPLQNIQWLDALYLASLEQLCTMLRTTPAGCTRLLLVGHNPGLEELLLYLSATPLPRKTNGKLLTTATLARLQLPDTGWSQLSRACAQVLAIQYPAELGDNS